MSQRAVKIYWPIGLTRQMPGRTDQAGLIQDSLEAYARRVVSPETTVTIGWMEKTASLLSSTYLGMMNDVQVVADILRAEREGYDAAMIGPHWDPGLYAARGAGIRSTGPGEAAYMVARTTQQTFAVLTVNEGYVPMIERNIRVYGCEARAIARRPVRRFGMTYDNLVACLNGTQRRIPRGILEDGARVHRRRRRRDHRRRAALRPHLPATRLPAGSRHRRAGGRSRRLRVEARRNAGGAAPVHRPAKERTSERSVPHAARRSHRSGPAHLRH